MHNKSKPEIKILYTGILILFALFLAVPLVILFAKAFIVDGQPGWAHITNTLGNAKFLRAYGNSFLISGATALITTILAFFLAYTAHNAALPHRLIRTVELAIMAPMFLPTITYGFVIMYSFGKEGLLTKLLGVEIFNIYGFGGMLLGYIIYTLPIAYLLINNTFKYVDRNFIVVSKVMGDGPLRTFMGTAVRPLLGTIGAAFIQSFTLSFTDFGIPASISGKFDVVATLLYNEMLGAMPNFPAGATISLLMLLPSVFSIILMTVLARYNFRYNKISRVELPPHRARDLFCGTGSMMIACAILVIFLVMFVVPFVKQWPYDFTFTLKTLKSVFASRNLTGVYVQSLIVAALTALLGTLVSYGAALVTARSTLHSRAKQILDAIAMVTNTIPGMVLGIAFLFAFSGTSLQNTFLILIICNVVHFFTTPYLMAKNSLEKMNAGWESTAELMGDSWLATLFRVVIPNSRDTILEMLGYFFINAMITISAVIFIAGARTSVLTTKIKELQHFAKFDEIFVLSLLILFTNILVKILLNLLRKQKPTHH